MRASYLDNQVCYHLEHAALLELSYLAREDAALLDAVLAGLESQAPLKVLAQLTQEPALKLIETYRISLDFRDLAHQVLEYFKASPERPAHLHLLAIVLGVDIARIGFLESKGKLAPMMHHRTLLTECYTHVRAITEPEYWAAVLYQRGKIALTAMAGWERDRLQIKRPLHIQSTPLGELIASENEGVRCAAQYEMYRSDLETLLRAMRRGLSIAFPEDEHLFRGLGGSSEVCAWAQKAAASGRAARVVRTIVQEQKLTAQLEQMAAQFGQVEGTGLQGLAKPVLATVQALLGEEVAAPVDNVHQMRRNYWSSLLVAAHLATQNPILE